MKMNRIALAALVATIGLGLPAQAQEHEKDEQSWGALVQTGSDADKTIARAQAVTKCVTHILKDWSFSAIRGEARTRMMHAMFDVLRDERFVERRGKWSYSAKVSCALSFITAREMPVMLSYGGGGFAMI